MEEKTLKTSNNFIKARYDITEQELKLVYAMFYKIQERMQEKKYIRENEAVEFSSQELCYWLGITKDAYHYIKKITNRLMTRVLSIEDPEKKMFEMTHFVGYAKYENATLSLIPDIKLLQHFIFLQENFTKIPVITLLQLKNVYAIKMYNLMLEYKNIRNVISMSLEEFRKFLQIEKKYPATRDLKRDVLDVIQTELNAVIKDLNFSYHFEREGRTYKKVVFQFNNEVLMKNDSYMSKYFEAFKKYKDECQLGKSCQFDGKDERCYFCKNILNKRFNINLESK